ncbi:hypothetical protein HORIV_40830 [Vreelandella olivaria]|uniref:Delta-aminolevulinic acid dehydratase n=1 Tax=Vreelandella olivaria TaxID=390919 RepID=A0ABM7GLJ7_9GAMM|nr:hypothetical protein HORIV_40830 [Halomonas olivaria]
MSIVHRPRRMRKNNEFRQLVKENGLTLSDLVQPIFIEEDAIERTPIKEMPGIYRIPESLLCEEIESLYELGIRYVMPFGVSHNKDGLGSDTLSSDGLLARMIRTIKKCKSDMLVIPDICFCEYTTHGHCGVVAEGQVDNDKTVENLVKQSLVAAQAGADMLAPSSMMDGLVGAIRHALDKSGYTEVAILAHAVKFSSAFMAHFVPQLTVSLKAIV